MYKIINNKNEYISEDIKNFPLNTNREHRIIKSIFDKNIYVRYGNKGDEWLWHLHLKLTDICNAKCLFCIEQENKSFKFNEDSYINAVETILKEQYNNGILYSVSLTGGEPFLFKKLDKLLSIIDKYNVFLTINTNGYYLLKNIEMLNSHKIDFINVSIHGNPLFNKSIMGIESLSFDTLESIKNNLKASLRIQSVVMKNSVNSYESMLKFIELYKNITNNFSFRQLISVNNEISKKINEFTSKNLVPLRDILKDVYNNWEFVIQEIQDYYVYETWKYLENEVTFSHSNMDMLSNSELKENIHIAREFILHPNRVYSTSWDLSKIDKIIKHF